MVSPAYSEQTHLMKRICDRPRTQRLALSHPKMLRRLGTVDNYNGHISHLHLVHIAIPLGPLPVLGCGISTYRPQVTDERKPRRPRHAGNTGLIADDLVDDDIGDEGEEEGGQERLDWVRGQALPESWEELLEEEHDRRLVRVSQRHTALGSCCVFDSIFQLPP